jgi:uncharacterized protein (DUF885 family)
MTLRPGFSYWMFVLFAVVPPAQSPVSNQTSSPANPASFPATAERFMYESLALSPVNVSRAGYHKHTDTSTGKVLELDAELDDLSPQGAEAQREFYRSWQSRFRAYDAKKLSAEDRADWHLIDDQIALNLLELERIQSYRHNPTVCVELIGNALFLLMTHSYAPAEVRLGHVLSRVTQIPRALEQARQSLADSDSIYTQTAVEENNGNIDLIESTLKDQIPAGSPLAARYAQVAPTDLARRRASRTWRLGAEFYREKFRWSWRRPLLPDRYWKAPSRRRSRSVPRCLRSPCPCTRRCIPITPTVICSRMNAKA